MLHYNYHEAINIRGKFTQSLGYPGKDTLIDFRTSLAITSNLPPTDYDWGNIPYHIWFMLNTGLVHTRRNIPKEEWKSITSSFRKHLREQSLERIIINPNFGQFAQIRNYLMQTYPNLDMHVEFPDTDDGGQIVLFSYDLKNHFAQISKTFKNKADITHD